MVGGKGYFIGGDHIEQTLAGFCGEFLVAVKQHVPLRLREGEDEMIAKISSEKKPRAAALNMPGKMPRSMAEGFDGANARGRFMTIFREGHFFLERNDIGLGELGGSFSRTRQTLRG